MIPTTTKQKVSLFQNLQSVPSKAIDLEELQRLVRYDQNVADKTDNYRKMTAVLGKEKADKEVKSRLMPAVSVAVLFDGNGRKASHILAFTGYALVDIDHVEQPDEALRRISADPHALMAYKTIGGQGLRVIYRYGRQGSDRHVDATTWKAAFQKGNAYFAQLTGHDYDPQCSDYTRLCGLAHDDEVYANWQAEPFIITDEEILAANFDATHERGKARHEDATGTHQVSPDEAWPKVEQLLERRGMAYQQGHRHDYAMHAAFLMNRYGVPLDELLSWASQQWADYDATERDATLRSCYKQTAQHGTWRLHRQGRKPKETSMITLPEIKDWLRQHVEVIYNVVTDQLMYRKAHTQSLPTGRGTDSLAHDVVANKGNYSSEVGAGDEAEMTLLDERVVCSMRSQMATDTGKRVLKNDVMDVLRSDFARLYHPVRAYIEALPQWDGKDRVKELCTHVSPITATSLKVLRERGADNPAPDVVASKGNYSPPSTKGAGGGSPFEWALHKWLVAMVATWMSDTATNHTIFVLIGSQGIYKTTFFRHLLPPQLRMYFWENAHNSFATKDDHLALAENCLVEIEEIDLQNPRDISELKALATSDKVKERRPYARFREEKHRLASFCGSGNQQRFLSDDTGNRRWLCFKVTHIDDPRTWGIDYDQLYAQLRDELRQGFRYWFDPQEQRIVEQLNQDFRIESDEEQLIRTRLRPPRPGEKISLMNAASICQFINGGMVGRGLSTRKVGIIMQHLGFKKVHTMQGNFFEAYQIPADQIQATLAITAETEENRNNSASAFEEASLPF